MAESDPAGPGERAASSAAPVVDAVAEQAPPEQIPPEQIPPEQSDAPRRRRGKPAVLVALALVVVVLLGFGAFFGWRALQANSDQARRDEVLQTARTAADNLTTIDYRTADRDVREVLDGSTPEFARQFGIASPDFLDVVKSTQLVSTGQVTSAAIQGMDERSARVLVAVNGSVRDVNVPQSIPRSYRLGMELVRQDDRWLVSKVTFLQ